MNDPVNEEIETSSIRWDKPYYYQEGQLFVPHIREGREWPFDSMDSFNAVTLALDGTLKSDLNWIEQEKLAVECIEKGYAIFWSLNLGLFNQLDFSLTNQTQYLSLCLSLDHFRDTIWKQFKEHSIGLAIYRGSSDFSQHFNWNEEQVHNFHGWLEDRFGTIEEFQQELKLDLSSFKSVELSHLFQSEFGHQLIRLFCRDVCVEYFTLLTNRLPDSLARYLLLDTTTITNPLWQTQLLHPERFEQFGLAVKGNSVPVQGLGWEAPSSYGTISFDPSPIIPQQLATVGICLSNLDNCRSYHYQGMEQALHSFQAQGVNFRLIPEAHLITEWDGLDYLVVAPKGLGPQGKRKLQGFCAAGGTIVTLGEKIGLSQEILLEEFL